jgi:pyruvate kinase
MHTRDVQQSARTKIVATVGPACWEEDQLADLVVAGVDVFRLNMAHAGTDAHTETVEKIRRVSERLSQPIAILVDLAGPKIRLGELPGGMIDCQLGQHYDFIRGDEAPGPQELTSTYGSLIDELSIDDTVMLADGTVSMRVVSKEENRVRCVVTQRGAIRSRQGINLPGVRLSVPTMSKEDFQHAIWAAQIGVDFVSLSFVRSPDDVRQLRELLRAYGSQAHTVAKIEKFEALERLEEIVDAADAVMVARGDLGVEIDVARMPMEQKRIISTCRRYQRPVIIATQMLDSMHHSPRPTRAEATDVANAILDGGDACMLSGETAIGEFPREAVETMHRIALATEAQLRHYPSPPKPEHPVRGLHEITQSVVNSSGAIAQQLKAKLIVVASRSGATALAMSNQRNFTPTVGVSDSETTLRRMCLYWGVTPLRGLHARDVRQLMKHADAWGYRHHYLKKGDRIVLIGGSQLTAGVHDLLVVHEVGERPKED